MTVYRYLEDRNPEGFFIPGVPLRDLTSEDLQRLPLHLRAAVSQYPFYERAEAPERAEQLEAAAQVAAEADATPAAVKAAAAREAQSVRKHARKSDEQAG